MFSRALQSTLQSTQQPAKSSQEFIARRGRKTFLYLKIQVCQVLFWSSKGLGYLFKVPQFVFLLWKQSSFLSTDWYLFSCFKHVLPWRRTVLPAAICLSPKHSCGSWQLKNAPWQLVFQDWSLFYFYFLLLRPSQGAEACSHVVLKWILQYFILSSYPPYRLR